LFLPVFQAVLFLFLAALHPPLLQLLNVFLPWLDAAKSLLLAHLFVKQPLFSPLLLPIQPLPFPV
jgi:hypothetical protein